VGLKITPLPEVKLIAFKTVLEAIEKYLNLFFWQFEKTAMMFAMLSAHQIVGKAKIATLKAHAYHLLSQTGIFPRASGAGCGRRQNQSSDPGPA
jgi:hypothetical protein